MKPAPQPIKLRGGFYDRNEDDCSGATSSVTFGDSFPTVTRLEFSIRAVSFRLRRNRLLASRAIGPCKGKRARLDAFRKYAFCRLVSQETGQPHRRRYIQASRRSLFDLRRSSLQPQTQNPTPDRVKRGQYGVQGHCPCPPEAPVIPSPIPRPRQRPDGRC